MSAWMQALIVGVIGVAFALVMMKRLRKRHRPDVPKVILPMADDPGDEAASKAETQNDPDGSTKD